MELIGYCDKISAAPGDTISFKVSTDAARYDSVIVRLIHGDSNGPGFKEEILTPGERRPGRKQIAMCGSFGRVESGDALSFHRGFTIQMWIYPTTPAKGWAQGLLTSWSDNAGIALVLGEEGDLVLMLGHGDRMTEVRSGKPLRPREWYFVAATVDQGAGKITLNQHPLSLIPRDESAGETQLTTKLAVLAASREPLHLAAIRPTTAVDVASRGFYNGKIERPAIFERALDGPEIEHLRQGVLPEEIDPMALAATWNFSHDMQSANIIDSGPRGLNGILVNWPMRAATGRNWTGTDDNFRHAPSQYGAIHFHDDDVEDACWETDFAWTVPDDAITGFYAARLRAGGEAEDHIPFFVRPGRHGELNALAARRRKALYLVPTMTYLAYANETHSAMPAHQKVYDRRVMTKHPLDDYLSGHPEFGKSIYDKHSDGSGVCYSSRLRPIPSLRPKYRQWMFDGPRHFAADLYMVDWLETKKIDYDVITDHDLHAYGRSIIEGYPAVITGTHPEYWTHPMRDAMVGYLDSGGSQMYLGGNGYYWITGVDPVRPHMIEIRRGIAGTRAWDSQPGELYMSTTGELGGLWRHVGKPPNKITGIGFKAMGYDGPTPGFRREPASFDDSVKFIFAGIAADEVIGNFGLVLGGAAGDEFDCIDYERGSPPNTMLLASARSYNQYYVPVIEDHNELSAAVIKKQQSLVRCDMTYYETRGGGAVFSAGAITWCASLSHSDYKNNVSTITENVLRNFLAR